jgi:hypothetical protein
MGGYPINTLPMSLLVIKLAKEMQSKIIAGLEARQAS